MALPILPLKQELILDDSHRYTVPEESKSIECATTGIFLIIEFLVES